MMGKLIYAEESYRINGACFEVYKEKGNGFLEAVYQECLRKEFALCGIPFEEKPKVGLFPDLSASAGLSSNSKP